MSVLRLSGLTALGLSAFLAAGTLASHPASAAPASPAVTFDNLTGQNLSNGPFTLGWQFTTALPITITALGAFDDNQDGLIENHDVGIWNSVGALMTSATVDSGTTDSLLNQFRYKSVSVTLPAGTYDIGALWVDGSDANLFPTTVTGFATAPGINFLDNSYATGGTLSDPNAVNTTDASYFGPNFLFTAAAPEPISLTLLGTGLIGLGLARSRRRRS